MMKLLFVVCILATFSVAMSWELEQEYHLTLAERQQDLSKVCSSLVPQMSDCLAYMTNEKTTKPTTTCCKVLNTVLATNAKCVCFALQYASSMGLNINVSRAEALPSLCQVKSPPINACNISVSSVPSPATPAPSPAKPAPAPVSPNPPSSPAPVAPNPPSAAPSPSMPAMPRMPPSMPAMPGMSPSMPAMPEAPTPSPASTSAGNMHIHMSFLVSFAVFVVSFFFSV